MTGNAMQARLDAIWEQSKADIVARVDAIEDAAIALLDDSLDPDVREHARAQAHKLAGVAGTFGFASSTDVAREAEGLLQADHVISGADVMRLSIIAVALRHELINVGRTAGGATLRSEPTSATSAIRVGMIDDDASMLTLVAALLGTHGIAVEGTSDPERLWRMLETAPPDVLMLDVDMPNISGIELCQSIRADARWDNLPIVFLTARTGASVELFSAGADNYLTKPVDGPELLAVIQRAARRQRATTPPRPSDESADPVAPGPSTDVDVVIVDDDAVLSELLTHTLGARGYSTHVIRDGSAALAALAGQAPSVRGRVIMLDVGLPGHDGLAVLRALARDGITRRTRVIMLTARSLESEVMQALDIGAYDHVGKPFSVGVLMHRIVRALAESPIAG